MLDIRLAIKLSALRPGRFYPQEDSSYSFELDAESYPRVIVDVTLLYVSIEFHNCFELSMPLARTVKFTIQCLLWISCL
jgi:hypothetical protein